MVAAADLLSHITSAHARDAFRILDDGARQSGLSVSYRRSANKRSVDLRREDSTPFSWITNRDDLLFYIRKPALRDRPDLPAEAVRRFADDVAVNPAGEVTIRIAGAEIARRLARWLFDNGDGPGEPDNRPGQPPLELSADDALIRRSFTEWRDILISGAENYGRRHWLPKQNIAFVERPELYLAFATSPDGQDNAVHINLPGTGGSENPLSGLGIAPDGRRYILRQGWLQPNAISPAVRDEEFVHRTGLKPVSVAIHGQPARRQWHIVASLDGATPEEIRNATGEFVSRSWSARLWDHQAESELARSVELFGKDETGGTTAYLVSEREQLVQRRQGQIWSDLKEVLVRNGLSVSKPRHFRGYEVDAVIEGRNGRLLVEIKSSAMAGDIYTGVGQLMLYPRLLPALEGMPRVLLVPGRVRKHLASAVGQCGVALHHFSFDEDRKPATTFSDEFLYLCGCK